MNTQNDQFMRYRDSDLKELNATTILMNREPNEILEFLNQ
jgi:hypothetical protein